MSTTPTDLYENKKDENVIKTNIKENISPWYWKMDTILMSYRTELIRSMKYLSRNTAFFWDNQEYSEILNILKNK